MPTKNVVFTRKHGKGLHSSNVYINGGRLRFVDDVASCDLEVGEEFEAYWRVSGDSGASFTLKYEVDGVEYLVAQKFKIPKKRTRKSDFQFFKLI